MRKSIQAVQAGGKGPRQRIWEGIRQHDGQDFELEAVVPRDISISTARGYANSLEKAGYLAAVQRTGKKTLWRLVKNPGIDAPRVDKMGRPATHGDITEALWGGMDVLSEFNVRVLAATSGASLRTAQNYCGHLVRAGYLVVEDKGKNGIPTTYRLLKSRNTGPRAPKIVRVNTVYDPNTNRIVWQPTPDEIAAELEVVK